MALSPSQSLNRFSEYSEKREISGKRISNTDIYKFGNTTKPNSALRQSLLSPVQLKGSPLKKSFYKASEDDKSQGD
jgi:hypothetical protein